ncbi:MAG: aminotransferase class V-fold PLP-dependent enzyme, partial [Gemmatimonadota bacterium]|nr:aminotransferase class V-fold PLP-dependent enzyme [Gemmatimonadota bacterium]
PLPEIAQAVRGRGVDFVLVDGAQSVGMIPVELSTTGVDAYAASPHKWLQAPKGLGLLWVSSTLRSVMPRMWFRTPGDSIRDSARKYEDYSTRAWPAVVALGDALDFQRSIGVEEKHRRYDALWRRIHERVEAESGLTWRSPRAEPLRSMIIAVQAKGSRAPLLAPRLLEGVGGVVRAFGPPLDAIRLSPNLCTTDDELERFLDALAARAG